MKKTEAALGLFAKGFSCSQAVFVPFAEDLGLDRLTALKISQAMGGGMGHLGQACGAVTGAFLAIGLKHGRTEANDLAAKDRTYALMKAFRDRFLERHGALSCPDLIGCDLGTAEGFRAAHEGNLFELRCRRFVEDAARILDDLLK